MANWLHRIDLASILERQNEQHDLSRFEEPCPEGTREAIAEEISKAPPLMRFAPKIRQAKTIAEMNRILHSIYDEADRSKVWCGL